MKVKEYCEKLIKEGYSCYEQYLYFVDGPNLKVYDFFSEEHYEIPMYSVIKNRLDQLEKEEYESFEM